MNQTGGRTKDGGDIVGASVFYNEPPQSEKPKAKKKSSGGDKAEEEGEEEDAVDKLDAELSEAQQVVDDAVEAEKQLSSHVWICTSTHAISKVNKRTGRYMYTDIRLITWYAFEA